MGKMTNPTLNIFFICVYFVARDGGRVVCNGKSLNIQLAMVTWHNHHVVVDLLDGVGHELEGQAGGSEGGHWVSFSGHFHPNSHPRIGNDLLVMLHYLTHGLCWVDTVVHDGRCQGWNHIILQSNNTVRQTFERHFTGRFTIL